MADTNLQAIKDLPDVSFIDNLSLEDVQNLMITTYQNKYEEITGKKVALARGDPNRVILLANAALIYQALQRIDKAGKMNFLKYAYGNYMDNLAATRSGVVRKQPEAATVTMKYTLEAARSSTTVIPQGSRVTADYERVFATLEYAEIKPGETETTVLCQCTETGTVGNGYAPGEITEMVDPIAFIASVSNTDTSSGGTDTETDDELAERTIIAPSGFSVAGPEDAYIYRCKEYSTAIKDTAVYSGTPGTVNIRILLEDNSTPSRGFIDGLSDYLTEAPARPLTDHVVIAGPDKVAYNIKITYYIGKLSRASAAMIQEAVEMAIEDFEEWQTGKIGRDINPDELIVRLKAAGVKRAVITEPEFKVLEEWQIAALGTKTVTYGGTEND